VVGENDRLVGREEHVEIFVAQTVGVFAPWLELHQVNHVNHPDFPFRELLPQQLHRGQGLERRHVAGARHDHIRLAVLVVAGPRPDADAGGAMPDGSVQVEPLRRGLFPGNNHVHVVAAAQAVIRHGEQRVRVGRQIDTDGRPPIGIHLVEQFRSESLWLCFHASFLLPARAPVVFTGSERISAWPAHKQAPKMKTHPER
jgi:hypothetical protein